MEEQIQSQCHIWNLVIQGNQTSQLHKNLAIEKDGGKGGASCETNKFIKLQKHRKRGAL